MKIKKFSEFLFEKENVKELRLCFVGDIMQHDKVVTDDSFENVRSLLKSADICVGNLETIITGENNNEIIDGQIKFSADESLIKVLKNVGFTHLSLINNHSLDYGIAGFQKSQTAVAKEIKILSKETEISKNDHKINLVNFTTHVNNNINNEFSDHLMTPDGYSSKAKSINIGYIHWGGQYNPKPDSEQKSLASNLINNGYPIVIGSGPHVNHKVVRDGESIIAYSLGDFISKHNDDRAKDQGKILIIDFKNDIIDNVMVYTTQTDKNNVIQIKKREII